jgi:hypothetical protein
MLSNQSSSDVPVYQGVRSLTVTTLSPCSAEIGMAVTSVRPSRAAIASYELTMVSKVACEKPS